MKSITQNITDSLRLTLDEIQSHHGKEYCCVTVELMQNIEGTEAFVSRAYQKDWEIGWTKEFAKIEELNAYIGSDEFTADCHNKQLAKIEEQIAKLEAQKKELIRTYVSS